MSDQNDVRSGIPAGGQLWEFLNSNFGLFLLSSVGLSLVTWVYTEVSQSVEQRIFYAELATDLDTEIEYRIRLMNNYFQSDCADHQVVSRATIEDIRDIYEADPEFQAISPENREKGLHLLIWERAALLEAGEKEAYEKSFNELTMGFNAYLTRFLRETERTDLFYGEEPNYGEQVAELIERFKTAIDPIFPGLVTVPVNSEQADTKVPDADANVDSERVAGGDVGIDSERADADTDDAGPAFDFGDTVPSRLPMDGSEVSSSWASTTFPPEVALDQPFFMPIDNVVPPPGTRTGVLGKIQRGIVKLGEKVEIIGFGPTREVTIAGILSDSKSVDEGRAGEYVALLLGGTKRAELQRGQVLAKPGSIMPHASFLAEVYFLTAEEGGRHLPLFGGWRAGGDRPQFNFGTTDVAGAVELPEDSDGVMPGDKVRMKVDLKKPIAMEEGLRFDIREGGRRVGAGVVYEILE